MSIAKILVLVCIAVLFVLLGMFIAIITTPLIGTLTIDLNDAEKDVYTIILNKEPGELNLKKDSMCYLKVRYLSRNNNTFHYERQKGQKGE